jgi:hypothetical protein
MQVSGSAFCGLSGFIRGAMSVLSSCIRSPSFTDEISHALSLLTYSHKPASTIIAETKTIFFL